MKIKIKLESLENILNLSNSFCTIPIIMDKSMMFGAYGVDLNMSEYIWYQLPEECKNKIYNYKEHIERLLCECDFPYSNMSVYFQNLGEIYAEFELEDWVRYEKEAKEEWRLKERERRKIREIYKSESISLEKMEEKEGRFQSFICNIHMSRKISKEDFEKIFSTYPLILKYLSLDFLILILKKAEELGIEISDNIKYDIGYCLADLQTEIMTEEEKKAIEEIRKKWNLKKVYED